MKKTELKLALLISLLAFVLITCGGSEGDGESGGTPTPQVYPRFAYVANSNDNTVSTCWLDATTGRLKLTATVAGGGMPNSVAVDPACKYADVPNFSGNTVSQYTIGSNGALTPMSPATVASGRGPWAITVAPSGKYAYVTNDADFNISQYTIGANGALTPMTPPTIATGTDPTSVTVDPTGKYAYVANLGGNVWQCTIGANGALTPMTPATIAAGMAPSSIPLWAATNSTAKWERGDGSYEVGEGVLTCPPPFLIFAFKAFGRNNELCLKIAGGDKNGVI